MNRNIQSMSRSFQDFTEAARSLVAGGTLRHDAPGIAFPVQERLNTDPIATQSQNRSLPSSGTMPLEERRPGVAVASQNNFSTAHAPAASLMAPMSLDNTTTARNRRKRESRKRNKERKRQADSLALNAVVTQGTEQIELGLTQPSEYHKIEKLMDSSLQNCKQRKALQMKTAYDTSAIPEPPSVPLPSDYVFIWVKDLSPKSVVKAEYGGTADLHHVHPSRRSQVGSETVLGRRTPSPAPSQAKTFRQESISLHQTCGSQGGLKEAPLPWAMDAATENECLVEIKKEASPHLEVYSTAFGHGKDDNLAGPTLALSSSECKLEGKEDAPSMCKYFPVGGNIMIDRAKRGRRGDEEGLPIQKRARLTTDQCPEGITERRSKYNLRQKPHRPNYAESHSEEDLQAKTLSGDAPSGQDSKESTFDADRFFSSLDTMLEKR
ncbi:MAG: hypothetical protein Q9166_005975 [cf. Caloplaca sp. 2 TL-2023]